MTRESHSQDSKYRELAQRVCDIAKLSVTADASLDLLIEKLKQLKETPYVTSTQKEARDILRDIIMDIENRNNVLEIEKKIQEFEKTIEYDVSWD